MLSSYLFLKCFLVALASRCFGLDNGLAKLPPMGFNTWERYRCQIDCTSFPNECISENLIKRTADIMGRDYAHLGYEYLVLDDCWLANERDEDGRLVPNKTRFPNGILHLSRYVQSKGLKFGIYGNFGTMTCAGYPGMMHDLKKDAEQFASWEVDFVKLDGCYSKMDEKALGYPQFGRFLNSTGRPILYSCSWPAYQTEIGLMPNYLLLSHICNIWRNFIDVQDSWNNVVEIFNYFGEQQNELVPIHGPGHYHDPDMLIIGNYGLSFEQSKVQMAMWCVLAAPLFISTDLASIKPEFKDILQNKVAIAINQDPLGIMGRRISSINKIQIWRKPILPVYMQYHSYAYVFLNLREDGHPYKLTRTLKSLGLFNPNGYLIEDVFDSHEELTKGKTAITVTINPSGTTFLRVTVVSDKYNNINY